MEVILGGERPRFCGVYKIANHVVKIISRYPFVHKTCDEYACGEEPEFCVETNLKDIEEEKLKAIEEDELEGIPRGKYYNIYLELTAVYRKITEKLVESGVFLFHGSVIAVDGEAYLITAKSGTGKSTHTALWRELFGARAVMVNDDKPLLELSDDGVIVYGTPWNGKHNLGNNMSAPLKAICILERGETNTIERLSAAEAFPMILQQSNRSIDADKMIKTLEWLEETLRRVPTYRLKCNMDIEAAKVAYEGMQ